MPVDDVSCIEIGAVTPVGDVTPNDPAPGELNDAKFVAIPDDIIIPDDDVICVELGTVMPDDDMTPSVPTPGDKNPCDPAPTDATPDDIIIPDDDVTCITFVTVVPVDVTPGDVPDDSPGPVDVKLMFDNGSLTLS